MKLNLAPSCCLGRATAFNSAVMDCRNRIFNGHLAAISSKRQEAELAKYMKAYHQDHQNFWIGLHDSRENFFLVHADRKLELD
uniref:Uncharacterized protein n=1 Tax=Sphaerodactylus townsendi TaxID=933632 RepID=A0ACB8FLQ8_9SAUR